MIKDTQLEVMSYDHQAGTLEKIIDQKVRDLKELTLIANRNKHLKETKQSELNQLKTSIESLYDK